MLNQKLKYWNFYVEYRQKNDEKDEDCLRRLKGTAWGRYKNGSLEHEYDQSYYMYMKTYDFII